MQNRYNQAKLSIHDRGLKVAAVVESLEREMELLCLTGVEDQLQADVRPTLELLRNAGIKVSAGDEQQMNDKYNVHSDSGLIRCPTRRKMLLHER